MITIQDESSMIPANVLNPSPGMRVLDMCAALVEKQHILPK